MVDVSGKTKAIILTAVILAALLATLVGLQYIRTISSSGRIKSIGCEVYWDAALTNPVSSVNWGTLAPGENKDIATYIKNTGNAPAKLTLGVQNFVPAIAANYINLYWNYNNSTIPEGIGIPVVFTIDISPTITGITSFSFDIVVIASG